MVEDSSKNTKKILESVLIPNIDLSEQIAEGGYGSIFTGEHRVLEKKVAVKILRIEQSSNETAKARFLLEAQILSKLIHPNIVKFHSFGFLNETDAYFVMDFAEGNNIRNLVGENGPLTIEASCSIITQIAEALSYAHKSNVVHRDIKPDNILITKEKKPILLDFGIAKIADSATRQKLTATAQIVGTPAYMSPEQSKGSDVTECSDQYSLCCVFYFMLTGKTVFSANSDLEMLLKHANELPNLESLAISKQLRCVFSKALSKNPSERFSSLDEFIQSINDADKTTPIQSKRKILLVAAFIVCCITAIAFWGYLIPSKQATKSIQVIPEKRVEIATTDIDYDAFDQAIKPFHKDSEKLESYLRQYLNSPKGKQKNDLRLQALEKLVELRSVSLEEKTKIVDEMLGIIREPTYKHSTLPKHLPHSTLSVFEQASKVYINSKQMDKAKSLMPEIDLQLKDQVDPIKEIEKFKLIELESEVYNSVGDRKQAQLFENKLLSKIRTKAIDETQLRKFFKTTLPIAVSSSNTLEERRLLKEFNVFLDTNKKDLDREDVELFCKLAELYIEKNNIEQASRLLMPLWLQVQSADLDTRTLVEFQKQLSKLPLSNEQVQELNAEFKSLYTKASMEKDLKALSTFVISSHDLYMNIADLQPKSRRLKMQEEFRSSFEPLDRLSSEARMNLLFSEIEARRKSGDGTNNARLDELRNQILSGIREQIESQKLTALAVDLAIRYSALLDWNHHIEQSTAFLEEVWNLLKKESNYKVQKLQLLNSRLWFMSQPGHSFPKREKILEIQNDFRATMKEKLSENQQLLRVTIQQIEDLIEQLLKKSVP